jgi:plastocyanin
MTARAFEPEVLRVDPGTEVTWRNTNPHAHSVTAYEDGIPDEATYFASGEFDSESAARDGYANGEGRLFTDEEFAHTFEVPGTYNYFCIPHEKAGMVGAFEVGVDGSATDAES